MKKIFVAAALICLSFNAFAVRKVSKVSLVDQGETITITYDALGRVSNWKQFANHRPDDPQFDNTLEYSNAKVIITGLFDYDDGTQYLDLDSDNLAIYGDNGEYEFIEGVKMEYDNGLLSAITWFDGYLDEDQDRTDFEITDGNPTKLYSDYWYNGTPEITYTDIPNKCGMVYLPMIINNTAWAWRAAAFAGLFGYGSRTLPYSCRFDFDDPVGVIDYKLDDEGYVLSMTISNSNDGDGIYEFEYTEVAGIEAPEIDDSSSIQIIGGKGCIEISGEYTAARVYTTTGLEMPLTGLAPGLYIVKADNTTRKVLVK